jgi:uncharacterized membrane protein YhaH (DUF805 family)
MSLQQWCFSFRGRVVRRDFWIWNLAWLVLMSGNFWLASQQIIEIKTAAFVLVVLLWPTAAIWTKRLHDRNKSAWWCALVIVGWMLAVGNWQILGGQWQWILGRFIPSLVVIFMLVECGLLAGNSEDNRFGTVPQPFCWR